MKSVTSVKKPQSILAQVAVEIRNPTDDERGAAMAATEASFGSAPNVVLEAQTDSDGLWLRLVDLEAALRARSYASDDLLVVEVRDGLCPWNAGRWRIGPAVERTDDEADLELDVQDLGSAYLGAFGFNALARAERVRELREGALDRATALFRTSRPPYCPDEF